MDVTENLPQSETDGTGPQRDPWDDDDDVEGGPTWHKSYGNGHKQRQYTVY